MTELILHKGQSSKALNLFKFDCKTNHESDVLLPTASHEVSALYKCTNEIYCSMHIVELPTKVTCFLTLTVEPGV